MTTKTKKASQATPATRETKEKEAEHWVDTFLLPGYEVSQIGRVRNKRTGRIVNPVLGASGYMVVPLVVPVHYLVAYAFEPNPDPEGKPYIRHKDGVDTNNFYLNLEFSADNPDDVEHYRPMASKKSQE